MLKQEQKFNRESLIIKLKDDLLEDTIICKYGQFEDFERRTKEHYGKLKGITMELVSFAYYVYEAETDLRSFFNDFGMKVEIEGRSEIVY